MSLFHRNRMTHLTACAIGFEANAICRTLAEEGISAELAVKEADGTWKPVPSPWTEQWNAEAPLVGVQVKQKDLRAANKVVAALVLGKRTAPDWALPIQADFEKRCACCGHSRLEDDRFDLSILDSSDVFFALILALPSCLDGLMVFVLAFVKWLAVIIPINLFWRFIGGVYLRCPDCGRIRTIGKMHIAALPGALLNRVRGK